MAEAHPVGFQWVIEAKLRGARIIHIDPRFTRTSALADKHVPIRAGSDIVLLGALINAILLQEKYFHEYVRHYTNAATIISDDFQDTEDLDGVFSGYDPADGRYDMSSWSYAVRGGGEAEHGDEERDFHEGTESGEGQRALPLAGADIERDETMQHPRCVLQLLRKHFARYTPQLVRGTCGISEEDFQYLLDSVVANSGRERTTMFAYAVGWTQHSLGAQFIRTAAILQLLLGNVGRPGGGIMALRGHASIQGASDIPTLFNQLPGYLPMPYAGRHDTFAAFVDGISSSEQKGYWRGGEAYAVSLLKAWWGDAAQPENDWCYDYLPRINGNHNTYQSVLDMVDGKVQGYFLLGQNPAVGSAHGRLQRLGMANLKWLVVRDLNLIESATFWREGPEIETGELTPEQIGTEVFFLPAAAHTEKAGSFTQTQRLLQWRFQAVPPPGDCISDLQFYYLLGQRIQAKLADSTDPRDRPLLDLTWDYPVDEHGEVSADAVLAEINGEWLTGDRAGEKVDIFTDLRSDGSTSSGCWIYAGVYAGGVNRAAAKVPRTEQSEVALEWGWAWPGNRRLLYNRASADPQGKPWSERKAYVWWDAEAQTWVGHDVPDFPPKTPPNYVPPEGATGPAGLAGDDPFIMQPDGKAWLFTPKGMIDGPLPTHYEAQESPVKNALYDQQRSPSRVLYPRPDNLTAPSADDPGATIYPYVATTYRLTEHHTAGSMSRWLPYLSELQPEFFCEISPELAAERALVHGDWATIISPRSAIEARVMVTRRMTPLVVNGHTVHQVGMPYHWGQGGAGAVVVGDSANDLIGITLDPNVNIQESKVSSVDIRPGRRPRGPALLELVADYRARAGLTVETGNERRDPVPDTDATGNDVTAPREDR